MISGHTSTSTEQDVKKMLLLNLLERLESNFAKRQRAGVANGQMAQLDLKKHGGEWWC